MNLELESIFYEESNIPPEFMLEQQVDQREFLSDGKMIPWEGQINEVFHLYVSRPRTVFNESVSAVSRYVPRKNPWRH